MVTLFYLDQENIRINITAQFKDEALLIEGYDIGKSTAEFWGDSDYEYTMNLPATSVPLLEKHMGVTGEDALLQELVKHYAHNKCFSEIQDLLITNNIAFTQSSY